MRIIYEFTEEDESLRKVFEGAREAHSVVLEISEMIRSHYKYENTEPDELISTIQDVIFESDVLESYV